MPFPKGINILSGALEIAFALCLLEPKLRKKAGFGIIALLLAFIPAHVYFIQMNSCVPDDLCVPPAVVWLRLVLVHPPLTVWAILATRNA
ncbi:MAG: hypothetical protein J4F31_10630 [Flavobacteriales bacterium]|nr:hypothetical protein [Flavobacteriales bacterium]